MVQVLYFSPLLLLVVVLVARMAHHLPLVVMVAQEGVMDTHL
jgi:hypothetical protein